MSATCALPSRSNKRNLEFDVVAQVTIRNLWLPIMITLSCSRVLGLVVAVLFANEMQASDALTSIDTGLTICKVRSAVNGGIPYLVASSYEGTVLGVSYQGAILWKNELSGFMNRDLWCADLTGDGADEILAANADGSVYCLDHRGELQWTFRPSNAPMNTVCVIRKNRIPYVVCGGYDTNIYYLDCQGKPVKTIDSKSYSVEKPWGKGERRIPPTGRHLANFLRPFRRTDGTEVLAVHGVIYSNSARGRLYLFEPLAQKPYKVIKATGGVGELRVADLDGDGNEEILTGSTSMIQDAHVSVIGIGEGSQQSFDISRLRGRIDGFGYRVAQPELVTDGNEQRLLVLFGSKMFLLPSDLDIDPAQVAIISNRFSYNDMWRPAGTNTIVLASAQSGGSCIHVLDLTHPRWKEAYANLQPPGKIAAILANTATVHDQLKSFCRPSWERAPLPVYLMSEKIPTSVEPLVRDIKAHSNSPVFLNGFFTNQAEDWDRSSLGNATYRDKRDRRRKYTLSSNQAVKLIQSNYENGPGIAFWGGHGNDPLMFSRDTLQRAIAAAEGKKTVLIYPELEHYDDDFAWVMLNHFYPLAEYCRDNNANLYIRTKHTFWQSIVYLPLWSRLVSGEFADVFVPAMEETTDKSMELSLAGRMGGWASGAVNQWGARCARDNTSFDRLRQFSHQMVPNHFLRQMVYNISCGATYIDNFPVDQEYMSLLWELIAKGALYVPRREEIVSFNPVHLSMKAPDERYLDEGNNVKWLTFYDEQAEQANPMVFSRLNGTWPGAPLTPWDFSRYAAGVTQRRLNFLPPYPNGLVLITPPQAGVFADTNAPRGKLSDHLHPLYKDILKEYITDGRNYLSTDGRDTFAADVYYQTVEADIQAASARIPLTVTGNVAWVAAESAPKHIRLTLVDSGYINPGDKTAVITCHTVTPVAVTDILTRKSITIEDGHTARVPVSCGLFHFIDVQIEEDL